MTTGTYEATPVRSQHGFPHVFPRAVWFGCPPLRRLSHPSLRLVPWTRPREGAVVIPGIVQVPGEAAVG